MDIQPRVLVVDADMAMLTSVAIAAEEEGFDVRTATDVEGAMRQCRSTFIDLVLIDTRPLGTSAADVLASVRTLKPMVRALVMDEASVSYERCAGRREVLEPGEKGLGRDRLHRLFARLRAEAWHEPWAFGDGLTPQSATAAGMPGRQ